MIQRENISSIVETIVNETRVYDIHTHLYPVEFGKLSLWGVDELLTYHYLIAEAVRASNVAYSEYWAMSKAQQADFIFDTLFVNRTPLSEATRGVLTVFNELGIELPAGDLSKARKKYNEYKQNEFIDFVFEKAGLRSIVMTNDPLDKNESSFWKGGSNFDERFKTSLRLDRLLNDYNAARYLLIEEGYDVGRTLNGLAKKEIRRFLNEKINSMKALYLAVSLPPTFTEPGDDTRSIILEDCVLPVAFENNLPVAMMIGAKRRVNPDLDLAGDSVGKSSIEAVEYMCRKFYRNKFMVTMLSRENQHELCVAARKFPNLLIFGCWWFLNTPMLIEEMTRLRLELLGTTFVPQHSDARILDQLIYKWKHSRKIISKVLSDKYTDLYDTGWYVTEEKIKKDVEMLFGGCFENFLSLEL